MSNAPNGPYTYEWPRPMVTVDTLVFRPAADASTASATAEQDGAWEVLLIERARDPFAGSWAIPGGFVDRNEDLEDAAHRELQEETQLAGIHLEQLRAFGTPGRDPPHHHHRLRRPCPRWRDRHRSR